MTEANTPPDTSQTPNPDIAQPADRRASTRRTLNFLVWVIVLLLIVLALLFWQWASTRQRFNDLQQALTQRLEQFAVVSQQSSALARQAEARSAEAVSKAELLEQQLAESRDQQENLETLYKELTNSREERTIAEIEQLLIIANQQLQLAGNIRPALLALQTAYARLQQIETPQAVLLRKTVLDDIQHLQNLPQANVTELNVELEALAQAVDTLPLVSDRHPQSMSIESSKDANPWRRLVREVWQDFKSLVRLERIDRAEPPLLTPEQAFFLRENVKLRLLMARIALLQHDEKNYRANMEAAAEWIKQYFDTSALATQKVLAHIRGLADDTVETQIPDINDSLGLVSKYKLLLERASALERTDPAGEELE
jgi:uroporphyrin-3 C-methyltransferase